MRKKILLTLSVFCLFAAATFAQTNAIEGGAGVIYVDGNPNLNLAMDDLSLTEGHVAYDRDNQVVYFHNPAANSYATNTPAAGEQWIAVNVSSLTSPITNILTPEDELDVSIDGAGVATITFTTDATISYVSGTNVLTFTDVDGGTHDVDLSDLATVVQAETGNASITVTGDGTSGTPYEISLTGADVIGNNGFVPVTNGAGTLTWTDVVESITVNADGTIDVTTTSGAVAPLILTGPKVENIAELNAAAGALGAGETGIAIADVNNTFGLTATSSAGVLFFISN